MSASCDKIVVVFNGIYFNVNFPSSVQMLLLMCSIVLLVFAAPFFNTFCCYISVFKLPPGKLFQKVLFSAVSFFFFFFMFASTLSLQRLDRSQPNFYTRWRGGLAQTLLKMGFVALTVWQPSWKNTVSYSGWFNIGKFQFELLLL